MGASEGVRASKKRQKAARFGIRPVSARDESSIRTAFERDLKCIQT